MKRELSRFEELEKIVQFAEEQGTNMYSVCYVYGFYRAINPRKAFDRTMEWIYKENENKHKT